MKRNKLLIASVLMLTGCMGVEGELPEAAGGGYRHADSLAVGFECYAQRSSTRAGVSGAVTTYGLKDLGSDLNGSGIGVFGYYSENGRYNSVMTPLYMYNQQVTYSAQNLFEYTPVKYWPNEAANRLSFFAYAPYVDVNRSTGEIDKSSGLANQTDVSSGIVRISSKDQMGDPIVDYAVNLDPQSGVDLCWGVAGSGWTYKDISGADVDKTEGMPLTDLSRMQSRTERVKFTFRHALAQLNIQVAANVDGLGSNTIDGNTRIYIRSVKLSGLSMQGSLNLNNTTPGKPRWLSLGDNGPLATVPVTIYDGRTDGREGASAAYETPLGLNSKFVEQTDWGAASPMPGVINVADNLFGDGTADADDPVYVIPNGMPFDLSIVYDVETADSKLLGHYLSDGHTTGVKVTNRINLRSLFDSLEAGKSYKVRLHIGFDSVNADVTVGDWVDSNADI